MYVFAFASKFKVVQNLNMDYKQSKASFYRSRRIYARKYAWYFFVIKGIIIVNLKEIKEWKIFMRAIFYSLFSKMKIRVMFEASLERKDLD